jgi:hypothetical protein
MLFAIVERGENKGIRVTPHKYKDGRYQIAKHRDGPYLRVSYDEIVSRIRQGYGVRMSNKQEQHRPGLFKPQSIQGWR